jgi:eukaryotic translation initiation factor 2C
MSQDEVWLFDGNRIAWCMTPMPRGELRIIINMDSEEGITPKGRRDVTVRENKHRVQIKQTKVINMAVIKAYREVFSSIINP